MSYPKTGEIAAVKEEMGLNPRRAPNRYSNERKVKPRPWVKTPDP